MAKGIKTGGRQKGTPNKITSDVREMVLGALDSAGGHDYLLRQSSENPVAFMSLIGRCLPKDVTVTGDPNKPVAAIFSMIPLGRK